jgi:alpha-glucoside transport system substrate-binding protein
MRLRKRVLVLGAMTVGTALALSGCSGGGSSSSGGSGGSGGGGATGTVNISGAFTGTQATAFQNELNTWSKGPGKGITVKYNGSNSFQTAIVTQVKGGQAPDVAIFPQPGVLKGLIGSNMVALDDLIDLKSATSDMPTGLPEIARVNGKTYGLPYSINLKSLVWYNPAAFKKAGLTVPTTDAELTALEDKIISGNKGYPWCVGIGSQGSNGWPMTDWIEQYVLDYGGLPQYNKWITHAVKFDSPLVKKAANKVSSMLFKTGAVNGGGKAIASTDFGAAGNNLFKTGGKSVGQCFMMRQGSFITGFFPKDIQAQIAKNDTSNANVFTLPAPAGSTAGLLGGGDIVGAFKNNGAVKKVVDYLVGKDFGSRGYAKQWSAHLSPHKSFDASKYATPFQKAYAKSLGETQAFGFDASDQMPGAVGAGTEWSNLTQWTAGQQSLDQTLKAIDASWPGQ